MSDDELEISEQWPLPVLNAIDVAYNAGAVTWITEDGERIAAIVPVKVAEMGEGMIKIGETIRPITEYLRKT